MTETEQALIDLVDAIENGPIEFEHDDDMSAFCSCHFSYRFRMAFDVAARVADDLRHGLLREAVARGARS